MAYGDTTFQVAGEVVTATGIQKVRVPVTSSESGALPVTQVGKFDVQAYWSATGRYKTLIRGKVIVEDSFTAPPA